MNDISKISESEHIIMRLIWENGGTVRFGPLMQQLEEQGRNWKPNTVLTFLTRLAEKQLVRIEKQGRLNLYHAVQTEEEYTQDLTQSFVSRIYGGNAKSLVASLLRQECLTEEDMDDLQSFWKEAKGDE